MVDFLKNGKTLQKQKQKTLATSVTAKGIGVHSGLPISIKLLPSYVHSGISFKRVDIRNFSPIKATWENVNQTHFCTTIANKEGISISTIEHIMAAFAACEIDNVLVEVNGPEIPIMDGSAALFVDLIEKAGVVEQEASRSWIRILKTIVLEEKDRSVSLAPASEFSIHFNLNFKNRHDMKEQEYSFSGSMEKFKEEFSSARTFGFFEDAEKFRAAGLAKGASLENAVVIHEGIPLNEEGFRFEDECVRHKVLDAVGDLYLAGHPLLGHYSAVNSGHEFNHQLLVKLFSDQSAWCLEESQQESSYHFDPVSSLALQQSLIPA